MTRPLAYPRRTSTLRQVSLDQQTAMQVTTWLLDDDNRRRLLWRPTTLTELVTALRALDAMQWATLGTMAQVSDLNELVQALVLSSIQAQARAFERPPIDPHRPIGQHRSLSASVPLAKIGVTQPTDPFAGLPKL